MVTRYSVLVCAVFLLISHPALSAPEDVILGKAGDYVVKQSDVDRMLTYYPPETRKQVQENPAEMKTLVKRMLEVKIIADVAKKEKFDVQAAIQKQLVYVMDDFLSKEYLAKVVMRDMTLSEADMKEFYHQHQEKLGIPEQVRARHILFKVGPDATQDQKNQAKARAEAVLVRLEAGEDYEKLAQAHSDDQSSRAKGGDLGYFTPGQMVREFEIVAFFSNPGDISDIVETQYGYHIIKVEDRIEARARSFEEAKDDIKEKLHQQLLGFKVEKFVRQAAERAGMKVYADHFAGD